MKKKKPAHKRTRKTQQEMADEQGKTQQAISAQLRSGKDPELVLQIQKEDLRIRRADAAIRERRLAILDEENVPREEVKQCLAQIAVVHGSYRQAMECELPSLLAGLSSSQIEREYKVFNDSWTERFADADSEVWKQARKAVMAGLRGEDRKIMAALIRDQKDE